MTIAERSIDDNAELIEELRRILRYGGLLQFMPINHRLEEVIKVVGKMYMVVFYVK